MNVLRLHDSIAAVASIDGVSIGRINDRSTWRIDYKPEATDIERAAGAAALAAFDPNAEEDVAVGGPGESDLDLIVRAIQAQGREIERIDRLIKALIEEAKK